MDRGAHLEAGLSPPATAGARWVDRYLLPAVRARLASRAPLDCAQIDPDDGEEIERMREHGHACDALRFAPLGTGAAFDRRLPGASLDLAWTGRYGRVAPADRPAFARELARALRPGGAFLNGIGNRLCPVDLSGNAPLLHGPGCAALATLAELEATFSPAAGFRRVTLLGAAGHFGWHRLRGPARIARFPLEGWWRLLEATDLRWLRAGPLNPLLMAWIER
ncbi:MAG: hypothetical protein KJ007_04445 [Burkholderiales bacterium]|nr:hypothetical protein [Burkholderiales bacterium]